MTRAAQFLLVLTCLAPMGFVEAAVAAGRHEMRLALGLAGGVVALVLLCLFLLRGVKRSVAPVPKEVTDPSSKDSEPLAFLVSYALPLVALKEDSASLSSLLGLAAFALMLGMALFQLQVFHVNPLLALFGYKFFSAKSDGAPVLILTQAEVLVGGSLSVIRVSKFLWLVATPSGDRP